jgi:hypothetical protein
MTAAEHLQAAIHWTIHPSYPSLFGGQLRTCEEMGQIGVQQPNSASFSPPKKKPPVNPYVVVTEVAYPHMTWDFY